MPKRRVQRSLHQSNVDRNWSHETEFTAEATSASRARSFVERHLVEHALPDLVDDVQLVVSELATNAMVHAETPFTVILWGRDDVVALEVVDGSQTGPRHVVARALDTNGRGVAIVQAVSQDWGVTAHVAGGKSVWAEFDIHPSAR